MKTNFLQHKWLRKTCARLGVATTYAMLLLSFSACKQFLDLKPQKTSIIPKTLDDAQFLLNYTFIFNEQHAGFSTGAADEFYVLPNKFKSGDVSYQNAYCWDPQAIALKGTIWGGYYQTIFYANQVMEIMNGIKPTPAEQVIWNNLKGCALFHRSYSFYGLTQMYAPAYDAATAASDLGISLRLSPGIDKIVPRSTVKDAYDQIITDLKTAIELLPDLPPHKTQASKSAAAAALSRVYLSMRDYENAGKYADISLKIYSTLIDYNSLTTLEASDNPFLPYHDEVLFHATFGLGGFTSTSTAIIDTVLYKMYSDNDLRPKAYFLLQPVVNGDSTYQLKYSYAGRDPYAAFAGLATDEMYLTRAECNIRANKVAEGLADLNKLAENRYKTGSFTPYLTADYTQATALKLVLEERRKELVFRGSRWSDIRRLNLDPDASLHITLQRKVEGVNNFILRPNESPRYAYLLTKEVIDRGGYTQTKNSNNNINQ